MWQERREQRYHDEQALEEVEWSERLQSLKDEQEQRKETEARGWVQKFQKISAENQQRKDEIARYWSERIRKMKEESQTQKVQHEHSCKDTGEELAWLRQKWKNKQAKIWQNNQADAERLVSKDSAGEAQRWETCLREALSTGMFTRQDKVWLTQEFKAAQKEVRKYEKKSMKKQQDHFTRARHSSETRLDSELEKLGSQHNADRRKQASHETKSHEKWVRQMKNLEQKSQQWREYDQRKWLKKLHQAELDAFRQEAEETQAWMKRFWEAREQAFNL